VAWDLSQIVGKNGLEFVPRVPVEWSGGWGLYKKMACNFVPKSIFPKEYKNMAWNWSREYKKEYKRMAWDWDLSQRVQKNGLELSQITEKDRESATEPLLARSNKRNKTRG
jgi:hypothetical protein